MAEKLNLTVVIDEKNVLREVKSKKTSVDPVRVLDKDDSLLLAQCLRRDVENSLKAGVDPDRLIATVERMVKEAVVDGVHDR